MGLFVSEWQPTRLGSLTFHQKVFSEWDVVQLTDFAALQVDQEIFLAEMVDKILHLPLYGGRQAMVGDLLDTEVIWGSLLCFLHGWEEEALHRAEVRPGILCSRDLGHKHMRPQVQSQADTTVCEYCWIWPVHPSLLLV